nr:MAG: hypothetical protein [Metapenaeopsis lamellata majanivirus]
MENQLKNKIQDVESHIENRKKKLLKKINEITSIKEANTKLAKMAIDNSNWLNMKQESNSNIESPSISFKQACLKDIVEIINFENEEHKNYEAIFKEKLNLINKYHQQSMYNSLTNSKALICRVYKDKNFTCTKIGGEFVSSDNELSMGYPVLYATSNNVRILLGLNVKWDPMCRRLILCHTEVGIVKRSLQGIVVESIIYYTDGKQYTRSGIITKGENKMTIRDIIPLHSKYDLDVKDLSRFINVYVDNDNKKYHLDVDNCFQITYNSCCMSNISILNEWKRYINSNKPKDIIDDHCNDEILDVEGNIELKRLLTQMENHSTLENIKCSIMSLFKSNKMNQFITLPLSEEELIKYLVNTIAKHLYKSGIIDLKKIYNGKIGKFERYRNLPFLHFIEHKACSKNNKKKFKTFYKNTKGHIPSLKNTFEMMHTIMSENEYREFVKFYKENETYEEDLLSKFSGYDITKKNGVKMRKKLRIIRFISMFLSSNLYLSEINVIRKQYFEYYLKLELTKIIDSLREKNNHNTNGWIMKAVIEYFKCRKNIVQFINDLNVWLNVIEIYPTGQYVLDGLSILDGSLETHHNGKQCTAFTPIPKHLRIIKLKNLKLASQIIFDENRGNMMKYIPNMSKSYLIINLLNDKGILSLISNNNITTINNNDVTSLKSENDHSKFSLIQKANLQHATISSLTEKCVDFNLIFRPLCIIKIEDIEKTKFKDSINMDNLNLIDIYLNQKHWNEIIDNMGIITPISLGKCISVSQQNKNMNSTNAIPRTNVYAFEVVTSLNENLEYSDCHLPNVMIKDIENILGENGITQVMTAQFPSKISIFLGNNNSDKFTECSFDADYHYIHKKNEINISEPYKIKYCTSMFIPKYKAGLIKKYKQNDEIQSSHLDDIELSTKDFYMHIKEVNLLQRKVQSMKKDISLKYEKGHKRKHHKVSSRNKKIKFDLHI